MNYWTPLHALEPSVNLKAHPSEQKKSGTNLHSMNFISSTDTAGINNNYKPSSLYKNYHNNAENYRNNAENYRSNAETGGFDYFKKSGESAFQQRPFENSITRLSDIQPFKTQSDASLSYDDYEGNPLQSNKSNSMYYGRFTPINSTPDKNNDENQWNSSFGTETQHTQKVSLLSPQPNNNRKRLRSASPIYQKNMHDSYIPEKKKQSVTGHWVLNALSKLPIVGSLIFQKESEPTYSSTSDTQNLDTSQMMTQSQLGNLSYTEPIDYSQSYAAPGPTLSSVTAYPFEYSQKMDISSQDIPHASQHSYASDVSAFNQTSPGLIKQQNVPYPDQSTITKPLQMPPQRIEPMLNNFPPRYTAPTKMNFTEPINHHEHQKLSKTQNDDLTQLLLLRQKYGLLSNVTTTNQPRMYATQPCETDQQSWMKPGSLNYQKKPKDINPFILNSASTNYLRKKRGFNSLDYRRLLNKSKFHPCKWIDYYEYVKASDADKEDQRLFSLSSTQAPEDKISIKQLRQNLFSTDTTNKLQNSENETPLRIQTPSESIYDLTPAPTYNKTKSTYTKDVSFENASKSNLTSNEHSVRKKIIEPATEPKIKIVNDITQTGVAESSNNVSKDTKNSKVENTTATQSAPWWLANKDKPLAVHADEGVFASSAFTNDDEEESQKNKNKNLHTSHSINSDTHSSSTEHHNINQSIGAKEGHPTSLFQVSGSLFQIPEKATKSPLPNKIESELTHTETVPPPHSKDIEKSSSLFAQLPVPTSLFSDLTNSSNTSFSLFQTSTAPQKTLSRTKRKSSVIEENSTTSNKLLREEQPSFSSNDSSSTTTQTQDETKERLSDNTLTSQISNKTPVSSNNMLEQSNPQSNINSLFLDGKGSSTTSTFEKASFKSATEETKNDNSNATTTHEKEFSTQQSTSPNFSSAPSFLFNQTSSTSSVPSLFSGFTETALKVPAESQNVPVSSSTEIGSLFNKPTTSLFGNLRTNTPSTPTFMESQPTTPPEQKTHQEAPSLFGASSPSTTQTKTLFSSSSSLFGSTTSQPCNTAQSNSLFSTTAPTPSTEIKPSNSLLNTTQFSSNSTAPKVSLFDRTNSFLPDSNTTTTSVDGTPKPIQNLPTEHTVPKFSGSPALFAQSSTPSAFTSTPNVSLFDQTPKTSLFETPVSLFGTTPQSSSTPQTTSSFLFGSTPMSGSLFDTNNTQGSQSLLNTNTLQSTNISSNIFSGSSQSQENKSNPFAANTTGLVSSSHTRKPFLRIKRTMH